MEDILTLLEEDTTLQFAASTKGGEYAGPCPWCGGEDRFRVWPQEGRYWCRGCLKSGDAIQYLRDKRGLSFQEASSLVGETRVYVSHRGIERAHLPPDEAWRDAADSFIARSELSLRDSEEAMQYLLGRGLSKYTIMEAGLGYNRESRFVSADGWGLEDSRTPSKKIFLPAGIVIPWRVGDTVWRISVRSIDPATPPKERYRQIAGGSNGLYNAGALKLDVPVILVEGEIDAISLNQELRSFSRKPIAVAVASGTTSGSRIAKWIGKLSRAPLVLVSFDADEAGDGAAKWWVNQLNNARRWRPLWGDPNKMLQDGVDIEGWVNAALKKYRVQEIPTPALPAPVVVEGLSGARSGLLAGSGDDDDPFSPDFSDDAA